MLSDAKFPAVRNAVRNWSTVGHPRAGRFADEHSEVASAIRAALADGKGISDLLNDEMRLSAQRAREGEIERGADELERVRNGLADADADMLVQIVDRHNFGLPSFTTEWGDEELIAWWASIKEPSPALMAFAGDFKGWWNHMENKLG